MGENHTRRRFITAGGTALVALTAPKVVTAGDHVYTDAEALVPPAGIFGPDWEVAEADEDDEAWFGDNDDAGIPFEDDDEADDVNAVRGNEDEYQQMYESETGFASIYILLADDETDAGEMVETLNEGYLVTAVTIDIGEEAIFDGSGAFAVIALRDRNAIAVLFVSQVIGFSPMPDRFVAIDGANALVDYWREDTV